MRRPVGSAKVSGPTRLYYPHYEKKNTKKNKAQKAPGVEGEHSELLHE